MNRFATQTFAAVVAVIITATTLGAITQVSHEPGPISVFTSLA